MMMFWNQVFNPLFHYFFIILPFSFKLIKNKILIFLNGNFWLKMWIFLLRKGNCWCASQKRYIIFLEYLTWKNLTQKRLSKAYATIYKGFCNWFLISFFIIFSWSFKTFYSKKTISKKKYNQFLEKICFKNILS
jgi:hypothetical protein